MTGYCEGVHIVDPVFGNVGIGIDAGETCYGCGIGNGTININGLYVRGGEVSCVQTAARLSYVLGGYIEGTHFGTTGSAGPTIDVSGCTSVQILSCAISGNRHTDTIGIQTRSASNSITAYTTVDNCEFPNMDPGVAVVIDQGNVSNTVTGIRVPDQLHYGLLCSSASNIYADNSGNNTNFVSWITSDGVLPESRSRS